MEDAKIHSAVSVQYEMLKKKKNLNKKLNNKSHASQATRKLIVGDQCSIVFFAQKTDCWAFWAQLNELTLKNKCSPAIDSLFKCFHHYRDTDINTVFDQSALLSLFYWTMVFFF